MAIIKCEKCGKIHLLAGDLDSGCSPKLPVDKIVSQNGGYLGWANSWRYKEPEIYKKCKHKRQRYFIKNHEHLFTCEKCGFWYKVDSSG